MPDFVVEFNISNKKHTTLFRRVKNISGDKYFISMQTDQDEIFSFEMKLDNYSKWRIVQPAPEWILEMENKFSELIKNNEGNEW